MTVRPANSGGEGGGGGLPAVWRETAVLGDEAAGACGGKGCPGEIASVVKMGQNAVLGVVTVLISLYWLTYEEGASAHQRMWALHAASKLAHQLKQQWDHAPEGLGSITPSLHSMSRSTTAASIGTALQKYKQFIDLKVFIFMTNI